MPTIRPIRHDEHDAFVERIIETSWNDLLDHQRIGLSQADIAHSVQRVASLLMEQGDNVILVADLPDKSNMGQIWLGQAHDPYSGTIRGYVYNLFVEPEARSQGVGKALMQAAEDASRQRGDKEMTLTVGAHNDSALTIYRHSGFQTERLTLYKSLEE